MHSTRYRIKIPKYQYGSSGDETGRAVWALFALWFTYLIRMSVVVVVICLTTYIKPLILAPWKIIRFWGRVLWYVYIAILACCYLIYLLAAFIFGIISLVLFTYLEDMTNTKRYYRLFARIKRVELKWYMICRGRSPSQGCLLTATPIEEMCLKIHDSWVLPLRCYQPLKYLRPLTEPRSNPSDSSDTSTIPATRIEFKESVEQFYDECINSPSELAFIKYLIGLNGTQQPDESGLFATPTTTSKYSLVSPVLRIYSPHMLATYRASQATPSVYDNKPPTSIVGRMMKAGKHHWRCLGERGFIRYKKNEALELISKGVAIEPYDGRVQRLVQQLCGCTICHRYRIGRRISIPDGLKPELFYFLNVDQTVFSQVCQKSHWFDSNVHLYSTIGLAMEHVKARTANDLSVDPCLDTYAILICRVTLKPGCNLIRTPDESNIAGSNGTIHAPPTLATPHILIACDITTILPIWYITLDEALTPSTPQPVTSTLNTPNTPSLSATAATSLCKLRRLTLKSRAQRYGLQFERSLTHAAATAASGKAALSSHHATIPQESEEESKGGEEELEPGEEKPNKGS